MTFAFTFAILSLTGLWDGTIKYDDYKIPFPIEFSQQGPDITASFFNGDERVTSTSGRLTGDSLTLSFDPLRDAIKRHVCGRRDPRDIRQHEKRVSRFRSAAAPERAGLEGKGAGDQRRLGSSQRKPERRAGLAFDRPAEGSRGVGRHFACRWRHLPDRWRVQGVTGQDSASGESEFLADDILPGTRWQSAAVRAGFAAAASGPYNRELKKEVTGKVEQLLTENVRASR